MLLTGIAFQGSPESFAPYVDRVAAAGAVGIGFGVGLAFDQVPTPLIEAADTAGISLFVVPRPVLFVSLINKVQQEIERRRNYQRERLLENQKRLNTAAERDGLDGLLRESGHCLNAHVVLSHNDGRLSAAAWKPDLPPVNRDGLHQIVRDKGFGRATHLGDFNLVAYQMGGEGELNHGLIALSLQHLDSNDLALLRHCAGLAAVSLKRPTTYRRAHQELNSLALAVQLDLSHSSAAVERVFQQFSDTSGLVRPVLIVAEQKAAIDKTINNLDRALDRLGHTLFHLRLSHRHSVVLFRGSQPAQEIAQLLEPTKSDTRIAMGAPIHWELLGQDKISALKRTAAGLAVGTIVGPEACALSWAENPEVKRLLGERERDTWGRLSRKPELAHTLESFLRNGSNISHTAEKLQLHRKTVRRRLDTIQRILELDFTNSVVTAELLIIRLGCPPPTPQLSSSYELPVTTAPGG